MACVAALATLAMKTLLLGDGLVNMISGEPKPRQLLLGALLALFFAGPAAAETLGVYPGAPPWSRIGGYGLLLVHIGGGATGLVAGYIAIFSRRGSAAHRMAGKVFFVSMFAAYAVGAAVAPFLDTGQRPNFVAGVLALYLLITAMLAARRRDPRVGVIEWAGLAIALLIAAAGGLFMFQGANDPSGTVDGSPPQAFLLFIVVGLAAAAGELQVLLKRTIRGPARISRHLWRMCASLFIAAGSFFLGQQQVLPPEVRGSFLQAVPVLLPVAAMLLGLATTHWPRRPRTASRPQARARWKSSSDDPLGGSSTHPSRSAL
jgi:hypothetical protein